MYKTAIKYHFAFHNYPLIWLRYIDDVFLLWTHGEEQLNNFISYCNTGHQTVNFTAEKSKKSLPLPWMLWSELRDGYLETDLYSKPTDTHQYLQWSSCHPRHIKESLPYSLAFRLRRICSTDGAFAIRIDQLKEYLSIRGYPANVIQKQIQKAKDISRSEALQLRQSKKKNEDRVPLVMTYDPSHSSISCTIQKYLPTFSLLQTLQRRHPKTSHGCFS